MPTTPARAWKMLKNGKAKVINRTPFTIQLNFETKEYTQAITLGVDSGSRKIGISASTDKEELYVAEVELRNDIVDLLSDRRQYRRTRRNRLRYRQARFQNRKKNKGWLTLMLLVPANVLSPCNAHVEWGVRQKSGHLQRTKSSPTSLHPYY